MPRAVKPKVTIGSDNVFTDLGFTNADEMLAKSELVSQINRIIESRGLTQVEAAKLLRVHQPKVSALKHGRYSLYYRILRTDGSTLQPGPRTIYKT